MVIISHKLTGKLTGNLTGSPPPTNMGRFAPSQPPLPANNQVKIATQADLFFLSHLQRIWKENLGHLNRAILGAAIDTGCAWLINENSADAGYMIIYPQKSGLLKVVQLAIDPQLLRTTLGTELMTTLIKAAQSHQSTTIRLSTRMDIPANLFWPTLGFTHTATTRSKNPTYPKMYEWTINLDPYK